MSKRADSLDEGKCDDGIVLGDQYAHQDLLEDKLGARPAAAPLSELKRAAETFFRHPAHQLQTEPSVGIGRARTRVFDPQTRSRAALELDEQGWGAMSNRVGDELVGYEPKLLRRGGVESHNLGVEDERYVDVLDDAVKEVIGANVLRCGLAQEAVYRRERTNPRRGQVEWTAGAAVGSAEQEQVSGGLRRQRPA